VVLELEKYEAQDLKELLEVTSSHAVEEFYKRKAGLYKDELSIEKVRGFYEKKNLLDDISNLKEYRDALKSFKETERSTLNELFQLKLDDENFSKFKEFLNRCDDDASGAHGTHSKKIKRLRQLLVERRVSTDIRKLEVLLKLDYDDKFTDYRAIAKALATKKIEVDHLKEKITVVLGKSCTDQIQQEFYSYTAKKSKMLKKACFNNLDGNIVKEIMCSKVTINGHITTPITSMCHKATIKMFETIMTASDGIPDIWSLLEKEWKLAVQTSTVDDPTPIHFAAMNPTEEVLKCLVDRKICKSADLLCKTDEMNNTPLHYAAHAGRTCCVDYLLEHGAEYEVKNKEQETPLHWAAYGGDVRTFNHIYRKYSNEEECLKQEAKFGQPLLYAAKSRQLECIGAILNKEDKADATAHDEDCDTALHYISKDASTRWLSKVLKANALLGKKNEVGNAPIDWISSKKLEDLLDEHTWLVKLKSSAADTSRKDHVEVMFYNIFGHHASGSDMQNIRAIAQTRAVEDLCLHPLCQAIVSIKWQKICKFFMLKLLFFIPFVFFMSLHPILSMQRDKMVKEGNSTSEEVNAMTTWIDFALTGFLVLLVIQIFFGLISVFVLAPTFFKQSQTYVNSKRFNVKRLRRLAEFYIDELLWSDWYEYMLWIMALLYVYGQISPILVVVSAWFSLFCVCSNHPSILPFRYMLVAILMRYIKFLLFASGLIGGFALGFFLQANQCFLDDQKCVKEDSGFDHLLTTALKVPSMMMGEISFDAFDFSASPYIRILFGSFIFLMACCMFNLMNGLAVNITAELEKKADIFRTIAQCEMIYEFEVLLKEIHRWLKYLRLGDFRTLDAIWVERIKVQPSSGDCQNLEAYNPTIHGPATGGTLVIDDLFETNRHSKVSWVWINRGYSLCNKIIRDAMTRSEEKGKFYRDPADVEVDFDTLQLPEQSDESNGGNPPPEAGGDIIDKEMQKKLSEATAASSAKSEMHLFIPGEKDPGAHVPLLSGVLDENQLVGIETYP
jgi:ankyrin repeat protein